MTIEEFNERYSGIGLRIELSIIGSTREGTLSLFDNGVNYPENDILVRLADIPMMSEVPEVVIGAALGIFYPIL